MTSVASAATIFVTATTHSDDGVCDDHCTTIEAINLANAEPGPDVLQYGQGNYHIDSIDVSTLSIPYITEEITFRGIPDTLLTGNYGCGTLFRTDGDNIDVTFERIRLNLRGPSVIHMPGGGSLRYDRMTVFEGGGCMMQTSTATPLGSGMDDIEIQETSLWELKGKSLFRLNADNPQASATLFRVRGYRVVGIHLYEDGHTAGIFSARFVGPVRATNGAFPVVGEGIGIWADATVSLVDTTIRSHSSTPLDSDGGLSPLIVNQAGLLNVHRSTLNGAHQKRHSQAIEVGGGFNNGFGVSIIQNSTITGFETIDEDIDWWTTGSGILVLNGISVVNASTLHENENGISLEGGQVGLVQTINSAEEAACTGGNTLSAGFNILSDQTCGAGVSSDFVGVNPGLGPLANNGGMTRTFMPLSTSPAIDTAPSPFCPGTDQRGADRPFSFACDRGSVEVGGLAAATGPHTQPSGSADHLSAAVELAHEMGYLGYDQIEERVTEAEAGAID